MQINHVVTLRWVVNKIPIQFNMFNIQLLNFIVAVITYPRTGFYWVGTAIILSFCYSLKFDPFYALGFPLTHLKVWVALGFFYPVCL